MAAADAHERAGKISEARAQFRSVLSIDPYHVRALAALGRLSVSQGRNAEGVELLSQAVALEPGNPNLHVLLAWALPKVGLIAEAEAHLRKAIEIDPTASAPHGMLGYRLQERGQFAEAIASFKRGLALQPKQAGSYFGIVQSKKITEQDRPLIGRLEQLLDELDGPVQDRVFLHYALGKAFDDLGQYELAIGHFDQANELLSKDMRPYDRAGYATYIDHVIKTYSNFDEEGSPDETPILVVGMPRSGTTLVEQVLSCHPEIAAGGEMTFWRDAVKNRKPDDPKLAADYLATLRNISPTTRHVTDKMPINFLFLGPIHRLLPKARIIHCKRNPIDTCLSIYMTRYVTPPEFANNRANIVFGYRQYLRLMAHWRSVLPKDVFLEVEYEELVSDRERVTRQMIEFCGLPWDASCLKPESNERHVTTPSLWQARQPVYGTSVARWKKYEPWLGEFRELLDGMPGSLPL